MRKTLLGLVVAFLPVTALAENVADRYGYYLSLSGGPTVPSGDLSFDPDTPSGGTTIPSADFNVKDGYAAIAAMGVYLDSFRGELEFSYRANDLSDASISGAGPILSSSGDFSAFSVMANAYYDLPIIQDHLILYIGAGAGVAAMDINTSALSTAGTSYSIDAENAALAVQAMIGLDAPITKRIHVTFGYRLWTALGADFNFSSNTGGNSVTATGNGSFDTPLLQSVELGLRIDL